MQTFRFLRVVFATHAIFFCLVLSCTEAFGQSDVEPQTLDPRLFEIVQIVKERSNSLSSPSTISEESYTRDEVYLDLVDQMQKASYSRGVEKLLSASEGFKQAYKSDTSVNLSRLYELHYIYANLLASNADSIELQAALSDFIDTGSWFERYVALSLAAHIHGTAQERQAALQKAQLAFSVIPRIQDQDNSAYLIYAKSRIVSTIAHLHNLQGNSELAVIASLDYLRLTEDDSDSNSEVDLINNLIYSYSIGRNHEAQRYLSESLLDIETNQTSSVPGLSEMRISGVMNSSGRYEDGLGYAERSLNHATNPTVIRVAHVNKAIALAGMGRLDEAREIAKLADINFSREHMLQTEQRAGDLYLAFLLAQAEDTEYATRLLNRQLDIMAQRFLANNSHDTTAMLAELENSRERQAEREAATARESKLQAITISRQRNLNRALIVVSLLMGMAAIFAILFTRYRGKVMRKLEIKTEEAASAEKLKTEFLGMISHELRTPLNGIIGISDYLANYHDDPDIRKKTGIVLRSGNELLSVVESLTDMARIDAGQLSLLPHDADLAVSLPAIPEKWKPTADKQGLIFTHFIDPAITRHHVDEDRLIQCIDILLANAMSFTDEGRVHLHITASKADPTDLTVVIADTGQGMSELVQSRLFTPFMQADTSRKRTHMGTGLSLAIAYALVEMMDGDLSFVSRQGRGSEFTLKIPLQDAQSAPELEAVLPIETKVNKTALLPTENMTLTTRPSPTVLETPILERPESPQRDYVDLMTPSDTHLSLHSPAESAPLSTKDLQRILIVDDMDTNRDIIRLILESKGHVCHEAADGFGALAALDRQAFDLVILDVHMAPLDGVETLRRIRTSAKAYSNIPVIALTADDAPSTNAECMEAGANLFLTKPVRETELLSAMSYLRKIDSARILSQRA